MEGWKDGRMEGWRNGRIILISKSKWKKEKKCKKLSLDVAKTIDGKKYEKHSVGSKKM